MSLGLDFKLLRRYREIVSILIKYGFQDMLAESGISLRARILEAITPADVIAHAKEHTKWERIRLAVEELGTTYIKFAQILSNRPDVIPLELVAEFEKLQSGVPSFPGEDAIKILEEDFKKPIGQLFASFDATPFASASIAQVHKAVLHSGETVVVKVRRPGIADTIELDLVIMKYFARKMEERGYYDKLDPSGIVRSFENAIHKEIDLTHEGFFLQRFRLNFQDDPVVYVPRYYPELTSRRVLTMEFIDGVHPYDQDGLRRIGTDSHQLAKNGMFALFRQIFEHGFFHADPHPGNLFAMPGNKVCFIDFGMMGTVLKTDIEFFADIVYGVTHKDARTLMWGLKNIALSQQFEGNKTFEYELEDLINEYHALPADQMNMSQLFNKLLEMVNRYNIRMPADYFLLSKCLITIEGVGHRLDPSLNIIDELTPHIRKTMEEELSPSQLWKRFMGSARESVTLMENLPRDLRDIFTKIKKGEARVVIEHEGLEEMTQRIDLASNRITAGFLVGSILMASSILIAVNFPPLYRHVSIAGSGGLVIAFLLGLRLFFTFFGGKKK